MEPDTSCYKQICSLFGEQILAADQKIDRKKLGAIVFCRSGKACHVKCDRSSGSERIHSNCRLSGKTKGMCAVCGRGGSSLLEEHYDEICDEIWYIYVDDAARRVRLKQSRRYAVTAK